MSFPTSPVNGQTAILNNIQYVYNTSNKTWTRTIGGVYTYTTLNISSTTPSVSSTTGALVVQGGIGVAGNVSFTDTSTLSSAAVYNLDDVSNLADGKINAFPLNYNGVALAPTPANPWNFNVVVNGVSQPAFVFPGEVFWHTLVLPANKGFTLDAFGNVRFADAPSAFSQIQINTVPGSNPQSSRKYPFNPLDIVLAA